MTGPKVIPDFGTDAAAVYKRQRYIKEHAEYFSILRKYVRLAEVKTLVEAREEAKRIYENSNSKQPLMIYAIYGPYDTWVETYGSKTYSTEKKEIKD